MTPALMSGLLARWNNMEAGKRRIILRTSAGPRECSFSKDAPHLGSPQIVRTADTKHMAKFAGYIQAYGHGFIPLDINQLTFDNTTNSIHLSDECIDLDLKISSADHNKILGPLHWEFKSVPHENGGGGGGAAAAASTAEDKEDDQPSYRSCYANKPLFKHTYPASCRYSCLERQVYGCELADKQKKFHNLAQLVIESFELELNGEEKKISTGEFSKPPYKDSCVIDK